MKSSASYWRGKVAIVTGGSAGFGRVLSGALAHSGAHVVIAARDPNRVEHAAEECRSQGHDVIGVQADVTVQADVDALIQQTIARFGKLDLLANNAGRSARGEALTTSAEEFRELLELNFLSVVRCTAAAAPHLITAKGHLVNIGSLSSKTASPYMGAYPSSKFPVAAYSQQLRLELGPNGVHVLLVCPGPIARADAGARYDEQAEDLPADARRPGGGVKLRGISPERLAFQVLRACERRQAELIVPAKARLLFAIAQLSPRLGDWVVRRMTSD